jgi:hypothetical protein
MATFEITGPDGKTMELTTPDGATNDMIRTKVQSHLSETEHLYPKTLFNKRHEEIRHHEMAVYQTMDILESLEARFITGQCDSEPRGYRGKGIVYYEDETLFG